MRHITLWKFTFDIQKVIEKGNGLNPCRRFGDSRAVLGTREKDNSLVAIQLTVDLKPNLPGISLIWEILAYFVEQWHQI